MLAERHSVAEPGTESSMGPRSQSPARAPSGGENYLFAQRW